MKGLLQGIVTRKKDDGKVSSNLFLSGVPFNQYEQTAERCEGVKVVSVYCGFEVNAKAGDLVDVEYEPGYEGKAVVSNVSVLKRKSEA